MKVKHIAIALLGAVVFSACSDKKNNASSASLKSEADTISYTLGYLNTVPEAMLKEGLSKMGSDSAYAQKFIEGMTDAIRAAQNKEKMAYFLGAQQGLNVYQRFVQSIEHTIYPNDSTKHIDLQALIDGMNDAFKSECALKNEKGENMAPQEMDMLFQKIMLGIDERNKLQDPANQEYAKANDAFMADIAKKEGVKPLGNGVFYKELKGSKGEKAAQGETLEVEYEGRLINDSIFDASSRYAQPSQFPVGVGQAVPGFDIALSNIPVGAEWEVYIPYQQGYRAQAAGQIKPFSTLIFKMKAVKKVK